MTATGRIDLRACGILVLAWLPACAATHANQPEWVDSRRHPEYPDGAYLIGVGVATNRDRDIAYQQARDRAVADLAGQLETHIRSEVSSYVSESLRVEDGESANKLLEQVSSNVAAVTSGSLTSLRPVEQSWDAESGAAAALVVIKRTDYAHEADRELAEIDGKVAALGDEADALVAEGKLFQAVRRHAEIEQLLVRRAAVDAKARFVWPARPSAGADVELAEVFAKRREVAGRVQMVLLCKHDEFGRPGSTAEVEQQFVRPFAELGIAVRPGPREAVQRWDDAAYLRATFGRDDGQVLLFLTEVSTNSRPAGHDDLIGVRSTGTARLLDANSGELLLTVAYSPDAANHTPAIGEPSRQDALVAQALARLATELATRVLAQM